jgi:hypothetical protein
MCPGFPSGKRVNEASSRRQKAKGKEMGIGEVGFARDWPLKMRLLRDIAAKANFPFDLSTMTKGPHDQLWSTHTGSSALHPGHFFRFGRVLSIVP